MVCHWLLPCNMVITSASCVQTLLSLSLSPSFSAFGPCCPQVPSLNSIPPRSIPRGSLVRFRCMIQDMFDPEFYLAVYETTNPADSKTVSAVAKNNLLT